MEYEICQMSTRSLELTLFREITCHGNIDLSKHSLYIQYWRTKLNEFCDGKYATIPVKVWAKSEVSIKMKTPTANCPSQETEVTSTSTRPVQNVVITRKGLQDRNDLLLNGRTVDNKGKLILTEISPSHRCKNMIFKNIKMKI